MNRLWSASVRWTYGSTPSTAPMSRSISIALRFAAPWSGPLSEPTAAVIAE